MEWYKHLEIRNQNKLLTLLFRHLEIKYLISPLIVMRQLYATSDDLFVFWWFLRIFLNNIRQVKLFTRVIMANNLWRNRICTVKFIIFYKFVLLNIRICRKIWLVKSLNLANCFWRKYSLIVTGCSNSENFSNHF